MGLQPGSAHLIDPLPVRDGNELVYDQVGWVLQRLDLAPIEGQQGR